MINLQEYYQQNSLKIARMRYVPKRYVVPFVLLHKGNKAQTIFKYFTSAFNSNASYRDGYNSFINETFNLGEREKILSLKDENYKGANLNIEYPFINSINNGNEIIKLMLDIDSINNLDDTDLKRLFGVQIKDIEAACINNEIINCGLNQNYFDFTIAKECILNKKELTTDEIAKEFYDLVIYSEIYDSLFTSIKSKNYDKCFETLKDIGLIPANSENIIKNINDLRMISVSELFFYLGFNISMLINILNYFSEEQDEIVTKLLKNYLQNVESENFEIISRRENETLESIGKDKGLTRERIRQIEKNEIEKFKDFFVNNFTCFKKNLIFIFPKICSVFPLNSLQKDMGNMNDCFKNLMKSISFDDGAFYSKEFDAIIEKRRFYEIAINTLDDVFGNYFKPNDKEDKTIQCLETLSSYGFDLNVISYYLGLKYRFKNGLYIKEGFNLTKVFEMNYILENNFDQGFRASNIDDINLMNKISSEEFYDILFDVGNPKSYKGKSVIEHCDVQLIDRGTYVHVSKAPSITIEMLMKVLKYIDEKKRSLGYANIYETFKEDLNILGINNKYELQGAMSQYKGKLFNTKKDYIIPIGIDGTLRSNMVNWILSQNDIFTYNDFKKEFKGAAQSVFASCLYEADDIAYYWLKGYLNVSKLNIDASTKNLLKKLLNEKIDQYHMEYCSADEIFDVIYKQIPDFITSNKITYSYDLFSVLAVLFKNDFKFKRPLIGSMNAVFETTYEIIDGYLASKNIVMLSKLRKFIDSKNGHAASSYTNIFEIIKRKWNEFVATDIDTIVRKDTLEISSRELIKLDVVVEMLLNNKKKLNIEEDIVKNYPSKEIESIQINKYLIFGLLNTYFNDKYNVTIEGNYRGGTFYIELKK